MDKLPEEETSIEPLAKSKSPKQQTSLLANPVQAPGVSVASEVSATKRPAPPSYRAPMVVHHPTQPTNLKNSKIPAPNKAVKFMAAAEVVHHFQKDTPERFHSRPARSGLQSMYMNRKYPAKTYICFNVSCLFVPIMLVCPVINVVLVF
jgi:hypothetical protein